ncbi:protein LYRIC isoform X3 [Electrophorus electricus]|uniref:protein LYRIC isoform X3 n=1 Tax=Electrophorus electricus TaxID=8005 RepID=UPI000F0A56E2|nr:protein LYRIC isoform X3 [Electrophorus electricus]
MARSWQEMASQQVEQMASSLRELFSAGLVFLHSELGVDLGLKLDLYPPWVILLTAWLGLCLVLILGVSVCRGIPKRLSSPLTAREIPENITPEPTKAEKPDEPKKKSRKKASDKKPQRNGLAVEPQPEVTSAAPQGQDPPEVKTDKVKKNKKKAKAPAKETKSCRPTERKEPDEAGNWETKVSNREKRQRRKDKGAGDGSSSPGGPEPVTMVATAEQPIMDAEEAKITIPSSISIKTSSSNPAISTGQRKECAMAEVPRAVLPQVNSAWEEPSPINRSSWCAPLSAQVASIAADTWKSMGPPSERQEPEPTVWPQEMEGSWTIVDGSHIPVSFPGLTADCGSADAASDWNAPCEEWGNYEVQPPEGAVSQEEPTLAEVQESDAEKDKDETTASGSSKGKKKKKRKKRQEEAGCGAQVEGEVGVAKDHDTAGDVLPKMVKISLILLKNNKVSSVEEYKEQESAVSSAAPRPPEPKASIKSTATPVQRKPEDSWESPKQVKKKKARRET